MSARATQLSGGVLLVATLAFGVLYGLLSWWRDRPWRRAVNEALERQGRERYQVLAYRYRRKDD